MSVKMKDVKDFEIGQMHGSHDDRYRKGFNDGIDAQSSIAIDLDREKLAIKLHKISGKSRGFYDWDKMPKWDREIFRLEADAIRSNLPELLVVVKEK